MGWETEEGCANGMSGRLSCSVSRKRYTLSYTLCSAPSDLSSISREYSSSSVTPR